MKSISDKYYLYSTETNEYTTNINNQEWLRVAKECYREQIPEGIPKKRGGAIAIEIKAETKAERSQNDICTQVVLLYKYKAEVAGVQEGAAFIAPLLMRIANNLHIFINQ